MWLSRSAHNAERVINSVSRRANTVGMVVLGAMMLFTVTDVFCRYALNRPILGIIELVEYMMVVVVFLAAPWCAVRKGNAKVDLLIARLTPRAQAIFDSTTCLLSLAVLSLISWQGFREAKEMWLSNRVSDMLNIPAYPFHLVLAIGCLILCFVLVVNLVEFITQAVKR